jgi:predicted NBD/HSP70 family sugar kinase
MLTLALDIGGSKIAAGLVDPVGVLVHGAIQPIPKNQDAERVWAVVQQVITGAMAAMIASVAAVCDLDLVVVGGGVAQSGRTLFDPLGAALASYAGLDFIRGLRVVPAALGGDAGLIGAARFTQTL